MVNCCKTCAEFEKFCCKFRFESHVRRKVDKSLTVDCHKKETWISLPYNEIRILKISSFMYLSKMETSHGVLPAGGNMIDIIVYAWL